MPSVPAPKEPATVKVAGGERKFVKAGLDEARLFLDVLDGETIEERRGASSSCGPWRVFSRRVEGSPLTLARLEAEVPAPPDELFDFLLTLPGKQIIDPFPKERHGELLQRLPAPAGGGQAEVVFTEAPRPALILRTREYITLDASAAKERLFVCKSAQMPPGDPAAEPARGHVRANLLFAMRVQPAEGRPGVARVQMANWLDLGRNTVPPWLANAVTERWYFQGVMRRLQRHLREREEGKAGSGSGRAGNGGGSSGSDRP